MNKDKGSFSHWSHLLLPMRTDWGRGKEVELESCLLP